MKLLFLIIPIILFYSITVDSLDDDDDNTYNNNDQSGSDYDEFNNNYDEEGTGYGETQNLKRKRQVEDSSNSNGEGDLDYDNHDVAKRQISCRPSGTRCSNNNKCCSRQCIRRPGLIGRKMCI